MLAGLAGMNNASQGWDVHLDSQRGSASISGSGSEVVVDLHALCSLRHLLPRHAPPARGIVRNGGQTVYKKFRGIIKAELRRAVETYADLECSEDEIDIVHSSEDGVELLNNDVNLLLVDDPEEQNLSCPPSNDIPKIVVTPCEPQDHHMSCRIPLQNSAFGKQLTVPNYPVFNDTFPPMLVRPRRPPLGTWMWEFGHWQATVPSLEVQQARELFSLELIKRRRGRLRSCV